MEYGIIAQIGEKQTVEVTAREKAQFEALRKKEAKKEIQEKVKAECETYRQMVDDEVNSTIPVLLSLNEDIKGTGKVVLENSKSIFDMKCKALKVVKDNQRNHIFTNPERTKRITLGVYVTDGYHDTVEDGIVIVKKCVESPASNVRTKLLMSIVLKLLARDAKGTLKASCIAQFHEITKGNNSDHFMEDVRIIEKAYQPTISRQFAGTEMKDGDGMWVTIPLGTTEAQGGIAMIYKVQFQIHRRGYREFRPEGLYMSEVGVETSVPETKRDVIELIKRQLSSRSKELENFQAEFTVFERLETGFVYRPKSNEKLIIIKEESGGTGE